jgi:2'-5' RNA ligase
VSTGKPHRVFFALWPDDDVARQFDEAGRQAHRVLGGRRMRRETLHLTLAFVGDVAPDRLVELSETAAEICLPAFDLLFDRGQCLVRKRIFWAAVGTIPAALRDLADGINERLRSAAFRTEDRPFAAHVTLLRHANCATAPGDDLRIEWSVRDFVLVESELKPEGASYRIVGRWPLRTGS